MGTGTLLHSGGPGNSSIVGGDMVCNPLHGADPVGVTPPDGAMVHIKSLPELDGQDLELPSTDVGHEGIRDQGDGSLHW